MSEILDLWEFEAHIHKDRLYTDHDIPDHYSRIDQQRILSLIRVVRKKDGLIADVRSEMTQIHGLTDPEWCRDTLSSALALTDTIK